MLWTSNVPLRMLFLALGLAWPVAAQAADAPSGPSAKPRAAMAAWDTGQPSTAPLASEILRAKKGWTQVPYLGLLASFQGDAVLESGPLLVVLRQHGSAAEILPAASQGSSALVHLHLASTGGELVSRLDRISLVENTRAAAALEVSGRTAKGVSVSARFRLKRGEPWLLAEPGAGAGRLRVACPSRFVVLPDFFADDILIDARNLSPNTAELPSENFVLHLLGQGDALAMCVFENRQQDVKINLAGTGEERTVTSSDIGFEGKKVWIALQHTPQLWYSHTIRPEEAGKFVRLDWTMPFPAAWRVDFTRTNGLTDSWEMLLQDDRGTGYLKPSWIGTEEDRLDATRRRWNTVIGSYFYPCWSDQRGQGYLQPLKTRALQMQGPLVIYPILRVAKTPLGAFTVADVMRNTLGVGPCEYILDREGQKSELQGRATCAVRAALQEIYAKKRQQAQRAEIDRILNDGLTFVTHIRSRITRYVDFGHKMLDYLAAQKKEHPELMGFLNEMETIVKEIDRRVADRADKIKTPDHVAAMNEDFRKNVRNDDGPEALAKCKKYAAALVEIGGNQDELVGECRWVVKALRQKAGLLLAQEPRAAAVATEIRTRTQEALRNPASHEGAHH
jgi:hypothetical protein